MKNFNWMTKLRIVQISLILILLKNCNLSSLKRLYPPKGTNFILKNYVNKINYRYNGRGMREVHK